MGKTVRLLKNVEEFLDKRDEKLRAKLLRQLKYVQEFGLTAMVPSLKKLKETNFWELRVLGRDNARLLCVEKRGIIWIIYGFIKKKQRTDIREIDEAWRREKEIGD
jgi:phage-related protein